MDSSTFRIHISAPSLSNAPGAFRISGLTMTGTMLDSPAFNYQLIFGGSAIAANAGQFDGKRYTIPVITFEGTAPPPVISGPEEPGPGPGPVEPPAGPPTVTIDAAGEASNGAQAIVAINGTEYVNLRYMMEAVFENGAVESTRDADGTRLAIFTAPHAEGPMVSITIAGSPPNEVVTARIGVIPERIGARPIDGSWYVTVQTFAQLFGFIPEVK
jgi:hypothetical protein